MNSSFLRNHRIAWLMCGAIASGIVGFEIWRLQPAKSQTVPKVYIVPIDGSADSNSPSGFILYTSADLSGWSLKLWHFQPKAKGDDKVVWETRDFGHPWIINHSNPDGVSTLFVGNINGGGTIPMSTTTGSFRRSPEGADKILEEGALGAVIMSLPDNAPKPSKELFDVFPFCYRKSRVAIEEMSEKFGIELFAFEFSKNPEPVGKNK
ncbi:MAG: hypothetical protein RL088_1908 [Verrucomicrobiota bacterium]|jgi:hypothetical protein